MAASETVATADQAELSTSPQPETAPRSRLFVVWLWPPAAIGVVAVAGQVFGALGAAMVLGQTAATVLCVAGLRLLDARVRIKVVASALGAGGLVLMVLLVGAVPLVRERGEPDLRGKTVTKAMVTGLHLRGADLADTRLDDRDLRQLPDRSLAGVDAPGASFRRAHLEGVSLRGAILIGADFTGACMHDVDLAGAVMTGAIVEGADVSLDAETLKIVKGKPAAVRPAYCR